MTLTKCKALRLLSWHVCSSNLKFFFCFSRCCDKKSCGNRNETPSDPVIIDRWVEFSWISVRATRPCKEWSCQKVRVVLLPEAVCTHSSLNISGVPVVGIRGNVCHSKRLTAIRLCGALIQFKLCNNSTFFFHFIKRT